MRNLKFVFISAGAGFVFSLFFGFFSHAGFLRILLRALFWGVVFGGLSFLIKFINEKFLEIEGAADGSVSSDVHLAGAGSGSVNLVISDTELESDGSANRYRVGQNRQMLNASDVDRVSSARGSAAMFSRAAAPASSEASVANADAEKAGFVPVKKLETLTNISGTEAVAAKPPKAAVSSGSVSDSSVEELDVLPDMTSFISDDGAASSSPAEDYMPSSDSFTSESSRSSGEEPSVDVSDAPLMAKAISSILSQES